jgi:hypothetical protein
MRHNTRREKAIAELVVATAKLAATLQHKSSISRDARYAFERLDRAREDARLLDDRIGRKRRARYLKALGI